MNTSKLDTSFLPALLALLKFRSVTLAAQELCVTQSAMSKTLVKARHSFSDELMIRSGKSYVLTSKAEQILSQLELLLPRIANLWVPQELDLENSQRLITIAGTDMDISVCKKSLNHILQQAPKAKLSVSMSHNNSLEEVKSGALDFLITASYEDDCNLHRAPLFQSDSVVVIHQKFGIKKLDIDDYLTMQHIAFQLSDTRQTGVDTALNQLGLHRNVVLWTSTFSHAVHSLNQLNRPLLLCIPRIFLHNLPFKQELTIYPVPFELHKFKIYLYWHKKINNEPFMSWVKDQLLKYDFY